jgi:hypothetical protein
LALRNSSRSTARHAIARNDWPLLPQEERQVPFLQDASGRLKRSTGAARNTG